MLDMREDGTQLLQAVLQLETHRAHVSAVLPDWHTRYVPCRSHKNELSDNTRMLGRPSTSLTATTWHVSPIALVLFLLFM